MITAVLLSWKRKANMPQIIDMLRRQTVPVEVWVINNDDFEDFGADRLIAFPWNAGEWARYPVAGRVETEYAMFQDDDFMLGDVNYLEDALALHARHCPDHIIGVAGRGLQTKEPYYYPDIINRDGYANILKGHFQLFKSSIVRRAMIPRHPSASDIYWSLDTANGFAAHYVSKELSGRLVTLNRHGVGYEFRPGHLSEREAVCKAWIDENAY